MCRCRAEVALGSDSGIDRLGTWEGCDCTSPLYARGVTGPVEVLPSSGPPACPEPPGQAGCDFYRSVAPGPGPSYEGTGHGPRDGDNY